MSRGFVHPSAAMSPTTCRAHSSSTGSSRLPTSTVTANDSEPPGEISRSALSYVLHMGARENRGKTGG